jgi:sialate O-acetylesterase
MKKCTFILSLLFISIGAFANIRLPNVITSNMVLQRESVVTLWGWANPQEKVIITTSWNHQSDTVVTGSEASWKKKINTPAAGGPYTITFKGANTIVVENVMIGEVWVCSGQSNMEWSNEQGVKQMIEELPNSANANIRLFNIPHTTSSHPQDNAPGEWKVCSPEALKGFSAVAYFFGKKLQADLHVPIGIINSSWGGTSAETWTPAEEVNNNEIFKKAAAEQQPNPWWPITPGCIYNAMIYPLANLSVSGAIWYQGESNTTTAATYSPLFATMINAWRNVWKKNFPFYYVQIAPFKYGNKNVGALLREQQVKTLSVPNTGMVVITDLVNDIKNIHPQNKRDVGIRLANYALAETYKQNMAAYKSPMFKSMELDHNKAVLFFDNAPNGFKTKDGKGATGFYIAGEDKNFLPADVKMEKGRIVVSNKQIQKPVAVRFAFSNTDVSNLFSKEELPVCPFRTDDWAVDTNKDNAGE